MDWKFIVAIFKSPFSGTISRITQCICFLGFCSLAQAANITFSGHVIEVLVDQGGAIYSDTEGGELFSGAINDATLEGFISDFTTSVPVNCCLAGANGLSVKNNEVLGADEAALLNSLIGTNHIAGDMIDLVNIEAAAATPGGGLLIIEHTMVFDAATFTNNSLENYPPDQNDILVSLVFVKELNSQLDTIFEAFGVVDELVFTADDFLINAGLNDAWVSADAPRQGLFFTVFPNQQFFFLSWFTFDTIPPSGSEAVFGAIDQRWVTGGGFYLDGSVMVSVELTSGGIFNGSDPLATQQPGYGTIRIGFISCSEAVLFYDFPTVDRSGHIRLARVLPDNVALCQAMAVP